MSTLKTNTNWHSVFMAGIQIELADWKSCLSYRSEIGMNKAPRRLDGLIVKTPGSPPIPSPIARCFRHYNLIDYKGPSESMTPVNYLKALSYAYSYPDFLRDASSVSEITLSLITHRFPKKLFSWLKEKHADRVEKIADGIYDIGNSLIPVQLILLPGLSSAEYIWLRCLTNRFTADTPLEALAKAYRPHENEPLYSDFMNAVIRANLVTKGEEQRMCEALYELFADELKLREETGIRQGMQQGIKQATDQLTAVIQKLLAENRRDDLDRLLSDPVYRDSLLAEFQDGHAC